MRARSRLICLCVCVCVCLRVRFSVLPSSPPPPPPLGFGAPSLACSGMGCGSNGRSVCRGVVGVAIRAARHCDPDLAGLCHGTGQDRPQSGPFPSLNLVPLLAPARPLPLPVSSSLSPPWQYPGLTCVWRVACGAWRAVGDAGRPQGQLRLGDPRSLSLAAGPDSLHRAGRAGMGALAHDGTGV